MDLILAVALSCTDTGCRVQALDGDATINASYSEPMIEHRIAADPGQLVVIDTSTQPARIVYRYPNIQVVGAGSSRPPAGSSRVGAGSSRPGKGPSRVGAGSSRPPAGSSRPLQQNPPGYILLQDGHSIEPDQLCNQTFPGIQAMYARLEAAENLDPKQVVEQGYDRIAERYLEWTESDAPGMRERYVAVLLQGLPLGATVLELGCGAGVPVARALAQCFQVTGVDISARQIALARQRVPQAHFIQADMAQLELPPESYDGIAAFYTLFHLPREEQPPLLRNIASWLRPGGLLVATMGTRASKGDIEEDWLGAPMYWSTYDSETNTCLVRKAGLEIVQAREETEEEDGEQVTFLWIIARKPRGAPGGDA